MASSELPPLNHTLQVCAFFSPPSKCNRLWNASAQVKPRGARKILIFGTIRTSLTSLATISLLIPLPKTMHSFTTLVLLQILMPDMVTSDAEGPLDYCEALFDLRNSRPQFPGWFGIPELRLDRRRPSKTVNFSCAILTSTVPWFGAVASPNKHCENSLSLASPT